MWAESARSGVNLLLLALSPVAVLTRASSFLSPGLILPL